MPTRSTLLIAHHANAARRALAILLALTAIAFAVTGARAMQIIDAQVISGLW
jgi:hypothetical protein